MEVNYHYNGYLRSVCIEERLFIDTSGPYNKSAAGSTYWVLVVDDYSSKKKWSYFLQRKSNLSKALTPLFEWLKLQKVTAKYVRCDNAGENQKHLSELGTKHGFTLEFTAPNTPQQNGVVEQSFVTLQNQAFAACN